MTKLSLTKDKIAFITRKYNALILGMGILYSLTWTMVSFFALKGVKIITAQSKIVTQLLLYFFLTAIIAPSAGFIIVTYYRSYYNYNNQLQNKTSDIKPREECSSFFKYCKQPGVWKRYLICGSIEALLLSSYAAVAYLAIQGIKYIINKDFSHLPQRSLNITIISISIVIFVALLVLYIIFQNSLQMMVWNNINTKSIIEENKENNNYDISQTDEAHNLMLVKKKLSKYTDMLLTTTVVYCLIGIIAYACAWQGIQLYSNLLNNTENTRQLTQIILSLLLGAMLLCSAGVVVYNYYSVSKQTKSQLEKCVLQDDCIKPKYNTRHLNSGWKQWFVELIQYHTQGEILQKNLLCWFIHAVSISIYSALYYLCVKGITKFINHAPLKKDWHSSVVTILSIVTFIALAILDVIFYYSLQNIIWGKVAEIEYLDINNKELNAINVSGLEAMKVSDEIEF